MSRATHNPFAGWIRCEECGTDADAPCYGGDDKPAVEVCEGRRFRVLDSADRTRRAKSEDSEPTRTRQTPEVRRANRLRVQARVPPTYAACTCCRDPIKVTGIASKKDRLYCSKRECRRAYEHAARVSRVGPPVQHKCWWCGVGLSSVGRSRTSKRPICEARDCRLAKERQEGSERRARRRAERKGEVTT